MIHFPIHDTNSASRSSKPLLAKVKEKYGFVPNLIAVMSESPATAKAYLALIDIFDATSFSHTEKQIILLTVSYVNQCDYCMAAHTTIGGMLGVPEDIIIALREGRDLADPKLDALSKLSRSMVETNGCPTNASKQAFEAAGYGAAQYLEVIIGVSVKTLSNYTNHAAGTPVDTAFEAAKWTA